MPRATTEQAAICARFHSGVASPSPHEKVGIALSTLNSPPLNALHHKPEGGTCGWYIWGGEKPSTEPEFFEPLCVEHLAEHAPSLIPYLALGPGWRVLLTPEYEDVWFDQALLEPGA
jgi:hypothetical protein